MPQGESYTHLRSGNDAVWPGCIERAHIYANRLQFSNEYTYVYALAIAINLLLLLWTIVESDYPLGHVAKFWVFVISDVCVTVFVVLEILVSLLAQGLAVFCSMCSNRVDVVVALFCIVALLGHFLGPTSDLDVEEELEESVLAVRYGAQLARLLMLVKNYRRQSRKKGLDIHLDLHCEPQCEPSPDVLADALSPLDSEGRLSVLDSFGDHQSLAQSHAQSHAQIQRGHELGHELGDLHADLDPGAEGRACDGVCAGEQPLREPPPASPRLAPRLEAAAGCQEAACRVQSSEALARAPT